MSTVTDWTVDQLPDLTGKTYLITGANSGLGFEAAKHLRRANGNVLVGARSTTRGTTAVDALRTITSEGSVELVEMDLASIDSIKAANQTVRGLTDGLDAVINNAGVMQPPESQTADGFELQFGTNHLGHFMLNYLTFDLVQARSGRIVPVSSIAHGQAPGIRFDDPMFSESYSPTGAYAQSKLANLMYGYELARRLEVSESDVISVPCHPGYSATNLQSSSPTPFFKLLYKITNPLMAQPAEKGALSQVLAAAGTEAQNGQYYGPTKLGGARGPVGDCPSSEVSRDEAAGKQLWELSEKLLGINWKV